MGAAGSVKVLGVPHALIASVGPFTSVVEIVATSIGAGLVIGGFLAGLQSAISSGTWERSERRALIGGYLGGFGALLALFIDILREHFV